MVRLRGYMLYTNKSGSEQHSGLSWDQPFLTLSSAVQECILVKFASSIKPGGQASVLEGRTATQKALARMKDCTDKDFYETHDKGRILHLEVSKRTHINVCDVSNQQCNYRLIMLLRSLLRRNQVLHTSVWQDFETN